MVPLALSHLRPRSVAVGQRLRGGPTLLALGLASVAFAAPPALPAGWRMPDAPEPSLAAAPGRQAPRFVATGDDDGDGRADEARLLVSADGRRVGLFVFLARAGGAPVTQALLVDEPAERLADLAIATVPPGEQRTACGKGYWDCGPEEPPVLRLSHDAIELARREGARSIFHRDASPGGFRRTWTSD